ncbi:hypothetical protein L6R52_41235, partial [Myxococcota bacterium]|nr:hypothetical protein [Myxococcota bacterium]
MQRPRDLVLVAHPHDEVLTFSSVVAGAHVVVATDHGSPPGAFEAACAALGAASTARLHLPAVPTWRLPAEPLARALATLDVGPDARVFTHDPLDPNPHHQDLVLAACRRFDEVWVPASASPLELVHVLDRAQFDEKLALVNRIYGPSLEHPSHPDDRRDHPVCEITARSPVAIEAFARTRLAEAARAASLTHYDLVLSDTPDTWAFETSAYEAARLDATSEVLRRAAERAPRTVMELGACEGLMTARIRDALPSARIIAVEPDPAFAARLEARFADDANVELVRRSLTELALEADLVVAAEVLYYVASRTPDVAARLRAEQVITSSHGAFDERVATLLGALGFVEAHAVRLPVTLERAGGVHAPFVVRRVGANVRLWRRAEAHGAARG